MNKVEIEFYPQKVLGRLALSGKRAQMWLDNEVLKDSAPFVPRLTGALEHSGIAGTRIGSGLLTYNTPYAAVQYYSDFEHSVQSHPQASRLWFETAKAVNKRKWVAGVKKLGGGG